MNFSLAGERVILSFDIVAERATFFVISPSGVALSRDAAERRMPGNATKARIQIATETRKSILGDVFLSVWHFDAKYWLRRQPEAFYKLFAHLRLTQITFAHLTMVCDCQRVAQFSLDELASAEIKQIEKMQLAK